MEKYVKCPSCSDVSLACCWARFKIEPQSWKSIALLLYDRSEVNRSYGFSIKNKHTAAKKMMDGNFPGFRTGCFFPCCWLFWIDINWYSVQSWTFPNGLFSKKQQELKESIFQLGKQYVFTWIKENSRKRARVRKAFSSWFSSRQLDNFLSWMQRQFPYLTSCQNTVFLHLTYAWKTPCQSFSYNSLETNEKLRKYALKFRQIPRPRLVFYLLSSFTIETSEFFVEGFFPPSPYDWIFDLGFKFIDLNSLDMSDMVSGQQPW